MKKQQENPQKVDTGPGKRSMVSTYFVYAFLLLFAMVIFLRIIQLQIIKAHELNIIADKHEFRFDNNIEAMRGSIYSNDGRLLATSIPVFQIRMDVASPLIDDKLFNDSVSWLALRLSKLFGDGTNWEYKQKLIKARKAGNRFLLIQNNVTFDQLTQLEKFPILNRGKYKGGLIAIRSTRRKYPFENLAKRTIGYILDHPVDSLKIAVGIEGRYNEYLDGIKGCQLMQRIGFGDWKPVPHPNNVEPVNGKDVFTTIDTYLQDVAHNSLLHHLEQHEAEKGTVILMEVATGEVRAMVNLIRNPKDGKYEETYNIAVGELFEPGSTFKMLSLMVAMEEGVLDKVDSVFIGQGYSTYNNREMKDSHRIDPDGWLTPEECLTHSSNVGISKIIYDHFTGKNDLFYKRLTGMFPADATGIDIPGEPKPFIKNPSLKDRRNYWSAVTLPWMSIGYEVLVTPLQMLTFYNAIANNGKMVKPMLVREIREGNSVVKEFKPEIIRKNIASEKTIKMARRFLESTVENGTAKNVSNAEYKIAGKTGTAKINEGGHYIAKYNASFIGYFPADNPQFSCMVVIYKPNQGAYYASQVAAPVFKEIADMVYAFEYRIDPQNKAEFIAHTSQFSAPEKQIPENLAPELAALIDTPLDQPLSIDARPEGIPDVTGLCASDAVYLLENLGLVVKINGKGVVKKQSLAPGIPFRTGDHIYLTLEIDYPNDQKTN
ncbi:MAG TPA: penicillin-binding protein [Bacteroidales bacterium]|nr:penicillin-binding protein [Bacteroidales bacterium]